MHFLFLSPLVDFVGVVVVVLAASSLRSNKTYHLTHNSNKIIFFCTFVIIVVVVGVFSTTLCYFSIDRVNHKFFVLYGETWTKHIATAIQWKNKNPEPKKPITKSYGEPSNQVLPIWNDWNSLVDGHLYHEQIFAKRSGAFEKYAKPIDHNGICCTFDAWRDR